MRATGLRGALAIVTSAVCVLALLIATALVMLTAHLHRAASSSAAAVESVRLAEEAEIGLLLHNRVQDALVRREIESEIRRKLDKAARTATSDEEARLLAEAVARVESYLAASRASPTLDGAVAASQEAAYGALEDLVAINLAQSAASQAAAARLDRLGNLLGIGLGALLVLTTVGLVVWLRGRVFDPLLALARAMDRFGSGDRDARADERGASELRDMCAQFNAMASAIAAQRQAQLAFVGGVAHDLRNPLSVLRMSLELVDADRSEPVSSRSTQIAARMARQIARMERMLDDFLDMAKLQAGTLELRSSTTDLRALVLEVIESYQEASPVHRIVARVPADAVPVRCDPLRIEQVLTNLISNAIKYSPKGEPIDVVLEPGRDEIAVSVADRGDGIAEADLARVFEPFQRVGSTRDRVPGVGLGLFVVRRLVEEHGGRVELQSRSGEGSTFRVILPTGGHVT